MKSLLDYLVRRGWRRGLMGGENLWLALGGAALALRYTLRLLRKKEELVFTEKLGLGETIIITHRPPKGHNGRREGPASQP
ncbi:MAG TPA: hypothetical protein VME20_05285 [Acidimicrobiales bacterium]|nr:hypothetical protein [Acidimicrobiales bacterium]